MRAVDIIRKKRDGHPLDAADIKLPQPATARYVRLLLTKASAPEGYALSELEVWGHGGIAVQPKPAAPGPNPPEPEVSHSLE